MSESERPAEDLAADAPEAQLVTADARRHFAAIRSEWLAPLLAELTDQADRIAQLEAAGAKSVEFLDFDAVDTKSHPALIESDGCHGNVRKMQSSTVRHVDSETYEHTFASNFWRGASPDGGGEDG